MKVLMFGWEFPPHISGGLGTACYGLTKGMSTLDDLDLIFVVPKAYGDEDQSIGRVLGANNYELSEKVINYEGILKSIQYIQIDSIIVPYVSEDEYFNIIEEHKNSSRILVNTTSQGKFEFSGKYGKNLYQEIANYAIVAAQIALDNNFDIIHAHDWLTYPAGIAAKQVSGKPLVVHVHATDFDRSGGNVNPAVYEIEKRGMDEADKVITVSNLTRKIVIEKYGISPDKVVTVYNAVDHEHQEFSGIVKGVNEKIVTFLGRITLQKGPEYFIEAAYRVLQKTRNVRFVMAGSGDMMNRMIHRVAALGISDRFYFTGFLKGNDVQEMYRLSDVYVMPSISEPFGISPLEAMQSDVPVIMSHQSGVSEIVKNAIKIDFWDIEAMADAIYGIINYPALSAIFIKQGRKEVNEMKWEKSAQRVLEVYKNVLLKD